MTSILQAMRNAASGVSLAENDSVRTEEDSVSDGVQDSGVELREINVEEEEEDTAQTCLLEEEPITSPSLESKDLDVEDVMVSYKDTEQLVSRASPPGDGTRTLYSSSSKCCKTKASIVISKTMFLLVGVAVLVLGAVLAGTIQHHPTGDDQCSNCSLECQSTTPFPSPTRTSDYGETTPNLTPTPILLSLPTL